MSEGNTPDSKAALGATIAAMLATKTTPRDIARRLVIYETSHVFSSDPDRGFLILNEVAKHFRVPLSAVRVVGSGQFGYSYFKRRDFTPKVSDLDLAIISIDLFKSFSELCYWISEGYTNLVKFPRPTREGVDVPTQFREYLSTGYFRPDLMPLCDHREKWFAFFNQLSNKHVDLFKNINGGIFLSESLLEMRNTNLVDEYRRTIR